MRRRRLTAVPVEAVAEDPDWTEYGLLILGIEERAAIQIGRCYGQNAIILVAVELPARLIDLTEPNTE